MRKPYKGRLFHVLVAQSPIDRTLHLAGVKNPIFEKNKQVRITSPIIKVWVTHRSNEYLVETKNSLYKANVTTDKLMGYMRHANLFHFARNIIYGDVTFFGIHAAYRSKTKH